MQNNILQKNEPSFLHSLHQPSVIKVDHLISTAKKITNELNAISKIIETIEDELRKNNANFPFHYLIESDEPSLSKYPEDRHLQVGHPVINYNIKNQRFLSWQEDEESKDGKFRLFILEIEKEIVYCDIGGEGCIRSFDFSEKIVLKQALRQTKIAKRIHIARYLQEFIDKFDSHLKTLYLALQDDFLF